MEWKSEVETRFHYEFNMNLWNQIMRRDLPHPDRTLRARILSDLKDPTTQHLIKLYTKECFLYRELNMTTRQKIDENIEYFGPFAAAFGQIVNSFSRKCEFPAEGLVLYRGTQVSLKKLKQDYNIGNQVTLQGFTSTSLDKRIAAQYSIDNSNCYTAG